MEEDEDMCKRDACRNIPGVSVRLAADNCDPPGKSKCPPGSGFTDCRPLNRNNDTRKLC